MVKFCGDVMAIIFFECDAVAFFSTHVTIATNAIYIYLTIVDNVFWCYGFSRFLVGFHGCPRYFHDFNGFWLLFLGMVLVDP